MPPPGAAGARPAGRERPPQAIPQESGLAAFLVASLKLCEAAGMVRLGVVALDGTKVAANAARGLR